ncbi:MAG: DEAD/DEAH box helicase, partial [Actinomycetota bacterium]|nr:DEAD/DEAH box helicase [Actinomycetota bacterium]
MSGVRLRPYQEDCLKAIADAIAAGKRRMVVSIPTGGGKTVVFSHLIGELALNQRALVLAHRDELILQTVDKINMVTPKADIGIVKASENQYWTQTVVASVQTVANDRRLASLGHFDLVIVDECHHAVAESWTAILTKLGAFEDDGPVVIGFTATPQRGDEVGLDTVFDEIVYDKPILELMDEQYLVDVRAAQVQVEGLDFSGIKRVAGDLPAGAAGRAMMNADAPEYVARAIKQYAPERRSLVFTPTVMVAEAVADSAKQVGLAAASLDGKTATGERRRLIQDFHDGRLQVLANCAVLAEGTDIPPVDCVVIARPTSSQSLFCLDSETEVLTDRGWRGRNDSLAGVQLAAFDMDGSVRWSPVMAEIRRQMAPDEVMYGISSPSLDLRVTDQHRMVFDTRRGQG